MLEQKQVEKCNHCGSELFDKFCSNCGYPKEPNRINGRYILSELRSIIDFEKGIFYTIKELLLRPGSSVQKFISGDRNRLVKPVLFIVICSLVYTIILNLFQFEDGYVAFSLEKDSAAETIFQLITENYGYANIIIVAFVAFWIKLFFRKHNYNYFEILILVSFLMGVGMLIFSFFGIIDSWVDLEVADKGYLLGILYVSWGIGQFFDKGKIASYLKALVSYMLGMFFFMLGAMFIGLLIDVVNK
ncbi:MAG: hypothetical protein COA74_02025 [Gammaproteobacteria bacterium]|nr:MAG: hypothetical protein COA74_02025 [Gammaproteobacteria bacterium]